MKNIIILSQQRTGSNLLCHAVSMFKPIRNVIEFFIHPGFLDDISNLDILPHYTAFDNQERLKILKSFDCKSYVDLLKQIQKNPKNSYNKINTIINNQLVLKIQDNHFRINKKLDFIFNQDVEFIVLQRRNTLEQFVSDKIAIATNKWVLENTNNESIYFDIHEYENFKKIKTEWYTYLDKKLKQKNYLNIYYEDDLSNGISTETIKKIDQWLNELNIKTTFEKTEDFYVKQSTVDVYSKIINYNQVKDFI